jgi:hypothetical protein
LQSTAPPNANLVFRMRYLNVKEHAFGFERHDIHTTDSEVGDPAHQVLFGEQGSNSSKRTVLKRCQEMRAPAKLG